MKNKLKKRKGKKNKRKRKKIILDFYRESLHRCALQLVVLTCLFFFLTIYFVLKNSQLTNNIVIVSGKQQRDSAIQIHESISPKLPSHLGCKMTLSGIPCWLSILNSGVYMTIPNSLTIPSPYPPYPPKP